MKKFAKILVCLMLCVFALSFVACGPQEYGDYPKSSDITYGNGGLSVRKGNYLFFVNGYMDTAKLTDQKATYTLGALMMKKLDASGNFVEDAECECFSNKLCGWKATDLHIVGDYLYFTSPCTEVDKTTGSWSDSVNRVWFNRVKLNKGDVETFYKSGYNAENVTFNYFEEDGKHYLLVAEKDSSTSLATIKRINLDDKKFASTTITSKACSYLFKNQSVANDYSHVFIAENNDGEYSLYAYNAITNAKVAYGVNGTGAVEVKLLAGNYVYITQVDGARTRLFRANVTETEHGFDLGVSTIYYSDKSYFVSDAGTTLASVANNKMEYYDETTLTLKQGAYVDADGITGVGVVGNTFVYYDGNKNIKAVDFINAKYEDVQVLASGLTSIDTTYFDLDDANYLYFYNKVSGSENLYLYRITFGNAIEETQEPSFFGKYLAEDVKEE